VEAARAGEAGMGFAVVADEVRNLAQRSAQAAKDTASLIEESIASSQEGQTRVELVARSISAITGSVVKVKGLVSEVSEASRQQTQGIDQVAQAVSQMEKVTQSTAATAEESAAASEELNAQAETTLAEVSRLEAMVVGSKAHDMAPPAPARATSAGKPAKLLKLPPKPSVRTTMSAEDQIPMGDTGTYGKF
jgi:methyl-accepting chemotaxis protein/methyl-accepting chemotaxis protein-1 (serine sensor receptor)